MRQGKPMKRTPLKRGSSQLKRTPLKKKSEKRNEMYKHRRPLVESYLKMYPKCQACIIFYVYDTWSSNDFDPNVKFGIVKQRSTVDVHELINRSQGGSILDDKNLLAVCRPCHSRITVNPRESEMLGLHLSSWCSSDDHFVEAERVRASWANGIMTKPEWIKYEQ